jgi:hypothetical protein
MSDSLHVVGDAYAQFFALPCRIMLNLASLLRTLRNYLSLVLYPGHEIGGASTDERSTKSGASDDDYIECGVIHPGRIVSNRYGC